MNEYLVISNLKEAGFKFNSIAPRGKNWPKEYDCRFIEPGLINYDDMGAGTALVRREALDKMSNSFKGRPVLFRLHGDATPDNFEDIACGIVNEVYFNSTDSWYHAKFFVWDDETKKGIESGRFSVSCAYVPSDTKLEGGIYNNINYDMEVLNGEYTHLAIVENPRYNGAKIFINSKGGGKTMKEQVEKSLTELTNALKSMFGKDKKNLENASKEETKELEGKLDTIISLLNEVKDEKRNQEEEKEKLAKKNQEDEDKKKDEEKKNAEDDKKKKEDEEKKNEEDKKEEEKKNAKAAEEKKHFDELKNKAANRGGGDEFHLDTKEDRRAAGAKQYGSEK